MKQTETLDNYQKEALLKEDFVIKQLSDDMMDSDKKHSSKDMIFEQKKGIGIFPNLTGTNLKLMLERLERGDRF